MNVQTARDGDDHHDHRTRQPRLGGRVADDQRPDDADGVADGAWHPNADLAQQFEHDEHNDNFKKRLERHPLTRLAQDGRHGVGQQLGAVFEHGDIHRRKVKRQQQRQHAQQPHHRGVDRAFEIVLRRLQAFGKHIGRRQHEGRAVHEHGHAAGQQLGGDLVHLLGRAEDGEQHPPAEEHLQIRAVHDAHRVQALQLFPQAVHDARVGHPVDVRQNDAGGRLLADDEFLERQRLIADDAPDGRDVFLVVLGKSRARPRSVTSLFGS